MVMRKPTSTPMNKRAAALRAAGLRPIEIWVPDTRRTGFAEECRRQCLTLRNDPQEQDTLQRLGTIADTSGWQ